jgi:hypothetical protein
MYNELYEYLILNRQLNLPGIGTISLETRPSTIDFAHREVNPQAYSVSFQHSNAIPAKKFFFWLADKLGTDYTEAIMRFNNFIFDLKHQVTSGNKINWNNVGVLSKGIGGEVKFEPALKQQIFDRPVSAPRIIREKAVHTVRVGEEEKTSVEMTEWLNPEAEPRSYWWAPALIAAIVLLISLGLYFSQKGLNASSAANQQKVSPQKESTGYRILR